MKNSFCLVLIFVLPQEIHLNPDSSEANLHIYGSMGQYANISSGCSGEISDKQKIPFNEISISIDHKTTSSLRLGFHGSYVYKLKSYQPIYDTHNDYLNETTLSKLSVFNPYINFEESDFAFGCGLVLMTNPLPISEDHAFILNGNLPRPSGYLRLGRVQSRYFDVSFFHTAPLLSTGYLNCGMG